MDASSGESAVWDRASGVGPLTAVVAGTAFPGTSPPIGIDGRWYTDGGLRSPTNADLAAGACFLLVIAPVADRRPGSVLGRELDAADADVAVVASADAVARAAFGPSLQDSSRWSAAFESGRRQAGCLADQIVAGLPY